MLHIVTQHSLTDLPSTEIRSASARPATWRKLGKLSGKPIKAGKIGLYILVLSDLISFFRVCSSLFSQTHWNCKRNFNLWSGQFGQVQKIEDFQKVPPHMISPQPAIPTARHDWWFANKHLQQNIPAKLVCLCICMYMYVCMYIYIYV